MFINKGLDIWSGKDNNEASSVAMNIFLQKGDLLQNNGKRYQGAIDCYQDALKICSDQGKRVKIYTKLALCYDYKGDLQQSLDFNKKVL